MRRICFISAISASAWGGSEFLWSSAAERLTKSGVAVTASVNELAGEVRQVKNLRAVGCDVVTRLPQWPPFSVRAARKLLRLRPYIERHVREIGRGAELVVISQGANGEGLEWMEACLRFNYPYAVIAHTAAECFWPHDDVAERLANCYERARAAYFVSNANLALTRIQLVTKLERAQVIRNPVNLRYDARPAWPSGDTGELALACVGRLDTHQKGQDLLLQVLSLPHWRERDVRVSLAGTGWHERTLRRLAGALRLRNVTFYGHVEDIEQLWSRHHALVLPSRFEGLPLAVVEAMLCGRPAIVTNLAGAPELIRDGTNGFLAQAPTVEFLDEAMNHAWEKRQFLREIGEQAAIDIRQAIPPDPTKDFVGLLETAAAPGARALGASA